MLMGRWASVVVLAAALAGCKASSGAVQRVVEPHQQAYEQLHEEFQSYKETHTRLIQKLAIVKDSSASLPANKQGDVQKTADALAELGKRLAPVATAMEAYGAAIVALRGSRPSSSDLERADAALQTQQEGVKGMLRTLPEPVGAAGDAVGALERALAAGIEPEPPTKYQGQHDDAN